MHRWSGKFKKMWSALDNEDYGEASFQMMAPMAKQTPKRRKRSHKMRRQNYNVVK